jgi:hypothetical protein
MTPDFIGVLEGFYGRSWSVSDRLDAAVWMRQLGFNAYLYAPKSDAYLRARWGALYSPTVQSELSSVAERYRSCGLHFGVGLSPLGVNQRWTSENERALRVKLVQLVDIGVDFLGVFFDDMAGLTPDSLARQHDLLHVVRAELPNIALFACPSYYSDDPVLENVFGRMPEGYVEGFGRDLPSNALPMWTGPEVCSHRINEADLESISARFGGPLALWDNYPVNDGRLRSNHLYLRPLADRARRGDLVQAHFCNPMNQANLSVLGLIGLSITYNLRSPAELQALADDFFGPELRLWLAQHAAAFEEEGLLKLSPERRAIIKRSLPPGNPAAVKELVDWLDDEYAFDPACLTDV